MIYYTFFINGPYFQNLLVAYTKADRRLPEVEHLKSVYHPAAVALLAY